MRHFRPYRSQNALGGSRDGLPSNILDFVGLNGVFCVDRWSKNIFSKNTQISGKTREMYPITQVILVQEVILDTEYMQGN
jgi:hypothetical protein